MKATKKVGLITSLMIAGAMLVGCEDSKYEPVEVKDNSVYGIGKVVKERGTAELLANAEGLSGREIIGAEKIGGELNYVIEVEVYEIRDAEGNVIEDESRLGHYTMQVQESESKPLLALASRIETGDTIKLKIGDIWEWHDNDKIGHTISYWVKLIRKVNEKPIEQKEKEKSNQLLETLSDKSLKD